MTFAGSTADGTPNMLACTQTLKQQQNAQNSENINENIQLSHIRRSKRKEKHPFGGANARKLARTMRLCPNMAL
jgi:hypothetical protein